ncbi:MAG TPA: peptidase S10 [Thermoanaerobaculia bacterium]|nr:peptidase S10 [Thermoanaerobaculia bacterium]
MNRLTKRLLTTLLALTVSVTALAQEKKEEKKEPEKAKPALEDKSSKSTHTVRIGGQPLTYTATAGNLVLRDEEGKARASLFYIAYTRDGVTDPSKRPITFSFNGGPGSSSVWLHLGVLGPRRVLMDEIGNALQPPYKLVDNEFSILDETDLVFIDPVTTGYSRAAEKEKEKEFHGFRADIESVGEFIRLYTTRTNRWASPKFLIGESYGTTRAAGVVNFLQDRYGMYFNGVMLVSSILNFGTARFDTGNDLPHILFLPTYTATAWYHKQLPPDLQSRELRSVLDEVEAFAAGEYTLALMKGNNLSEAEKKSLARKLARYTGLTPDYIERTNHRIEIGRFVKELRRDERITVGRLDSRFTGVDRDAAGERYEFDPSYAVIQGPFTGAFLSYIRGELKYESDLPYEILTGRVQPWSYKEFEGRYVNVSEDLRRAMSQNPHLQVYVANGYYDLATPYFATEYTFDHVGHDDSYKKRVTMTYYEAGHMMYIHMPSLRQQKNDLAAFIRKSVPR